MARLNRVSPIGVPQHIVQRGNNRQVCFGSEEDMKVYLGWLKEFSKKNFVDVHAWVLMRNNFTLTPIIRPQLFTQADTFLRQYSSREFRVYDGVFTGGEISYICVGAYNVSYGASVNVAQGLNRLQVPA